MNVSCSTCATVYRVDPAKVPAAGVRARCATCSGVIVVGRAPAAATPAQAPAAVAPPAHPAAPVMRPSRPFTVTRPTAPPPAAAPPPPPRPAPPPAVARPAAPPAPPPAPAPAAPQRPSAPVFRPTPGTPAQAPSALRPRATPVTAPAGTAAAPGAARPVNPFLAQDPRQKARRLARALVSDMIVYQPDKRQKALRDGSLKAAFQEEIKKSWEEYVQQVGEELAKSTSFFNDALNEILAGGQRVF